MKTLVLRCALASVQGGLAALAVLAVCAALRRLRAPSRVLCWLWLAVGLRFLLPGIPLALPRPRSTPLAEAADAVQALTAPGTAMPAAALVSPALPAAAPWYARITVWHVLAAVWAAGVLALAVRSVISYRRLARRVALAYKTDDGRFTAPEVESPFTLGVLRPRIFLPAGLRGPERAAVLRPERTHIARGDTVTKPLFYAIACLHWPNPLVWLAFAQFERTMECACDEAAVRGLVPERRRDYGESILRFAALPRGRAPCSLAFSRGRVKERVVRVLRYRRPGRLALLGCALTALLTAAACMVRPTVAAAVQPPVLRDVPAAPEATPAPAPTPTPAPAFTAPLTSYTRFTTPYDEQGHTGLDIAAPRGTPVYAAADGTVAESGYDNVGAQSRGNFVRILHTGAGDWSTLYAHLDSCAVAAGETVTAGQVIGYVGDSGYAFGEHLHFELLQNGVPVDPQAWVAFPAAE